MSKKLQKYAPDEWTGETDLSLETTAKPLIEKEDTSNKIEQNDEDFDLQLNANNIPLQFHPKNSSRIFPFFIGIFLNEILNLLELSIFEKIVVLPGFSFFGIFLGCKMIGLIIAANICSQIRKEKNIIISISGIRIFFSMIMPFLVILHNFSLNFLKPIKLLCIFIFGIECILLGIIETSQVCMPLLLVGRAKPELDFCNGKFQIAIELARIIAYITIYGFSEMISFPILAIIIPILSIGSTLCFAFMTSKQSGMVFLQKIQEKNIPYWKKVFVIFQIWITKPFLFLIIFLSGLLNFSSLQTLLPNLYETHFLKFKESTNYLIICYSFGGIIGSCIFLLTAYFIEYTSLAIWTFLAIPSFVLFSWGWYYTIPKWEIYGSVFYGLVIILFMIGNSSLRVSLKYHIQAYCDGYMIRMIGRSEGYFVGILLLVEHIFGSLYQFSILGSKDLIGETKEDQLNLGLLCISIAFFIIGISLCAFAALVGFLEFKHYKSAAQYYNPLNAFDDSEDIPQRDIGSSNINIQIDDDDQTI